MKPFRHILYVLCVSLITIGLPELYLNNPERPGQAVVHVMVLIVMAILWVTDRAWGPRATKEDKSPEYTPDIDESEDEKYR